MNEGRLFLLQVWTDVDRFRAALRAVDETQVIRFDAAQALCDHVSQIAHANAVRAEPDAGPASSVGPGRLSTPSDPVNEGGMS